MQKNKIGHDKNEIYELDAENIDEMDTTTTVRLHEILRDKTEYDGFGGLGGFTVFVLMCLLIPMLLLPQDYLSRAYVNQDLADYTRNDDDGGFFSVENPVDSLDFMSSLPRSLIEDGIDYGYTQQGVFIGQSRVKFIFMLSTFPYTRKHLSHDAYESVTLALNNTPTNMKNGLECENDNYYGEGYKTCKIAIYYQNYSRVQALERLNYWEYDLLADVATGIRYNELTIMTQNPTPVDGISGYGDGAIHRFMYSPFIGREAPNMITGYPWLIGFAIRTRGFYYSSLDGFILLCQVVFTLMTAMMIFEEIDDLRLTRLKHGSILAYYTNAWNILDMVGCFTACIVILTWWFKILPFSSYLDSYKDPTSLTDIDEVIQFGTWFTLWLGSQGLNFMMVSSFESGAFLKVFRRIASQL